MDVQQSIVIDGKKTRLYDGEFLGGNRDYKFIYTGERRNPKKGEYFLSGACPKAYEAFNDLDRPRPIAKKIKVKKIEQPIIKIEYELI